MLVSCSKPVSVESACEALRFCVSVCRPGVVAELSPLTWGRFRNEMQLTHESSSQPSVDY